MMRIIKIRALSFHSQLNSPKSVRSNLAIFLLLQLQKVEVNSILCDGDYTKNIASQ